MKPVCKPSLRVTGGNRLKHQVLADKRRESLIKDLQPSWTYQLISGTEKEATDCLKAMGWWRELFLGNHDLSNVLL